MTEKLDKIRDEKTYDVIPELNDVFLIDVPPLKKADDTEEFAHA
jgi:hypothetical protein